MTQLENTLRMVWGTMLAASLKTDDRYIQAAFAKADQECRKTGLMAKEVRFIEPEN